VAIRNCTFENNQAGDIAAGVFAGDSSKVSIRWGHHTGAGAQASIADAVHDAFKGSYGGAQQNQLMQSHRVT
jgi:hypothetical protein